MSSLGKKIQENQDKDTLLQVFNKKAKHRCPTCHRFTLYRPPVVNGKFDTKSTKRVCHWCNK